MRVELSHHGAQRLRERVRVSERKMQRLAEKAYRLKHESDIRKRKFAVHRNELHHKKKYAKYVRYYEVMGYVFVFREYPHKAVLLTVF